MIEDARGFAENVTLPADVVVVGTGAGGGMAARELASRGAKVIALDEGAYLRPQDMSQLEDDMIAKLYRDKGALMTESHDIHILTGRTVGGSTVHNINLCKRTPPEILLDWRDRLGVSGCAPEDLAPVFESVERDLGVVEIPAAWRNANNRALERGVAALGWRGGPLKHNRSGCAQSGFCEIGCPFNAKQNSAKVLLPEAMDRGARVLSNVRVTRIHHHGGRATGVEGRVRRADRSLGPVVMVPASAVVLAGGAIGSAALAVSSALPDPHDQLGRELHLHPGVAVAGVFDEDIIGWKGVPQSYECTEWLDFSPGSERRVWITTVFAHPIGAAIMLPGFGEEHAAWMHRYPKLAVLTAMLHDLTSGRVTADSDGQPLVYYDLLDSDLAQLVSGVQACARLLFAGGAKQVLVPNAQRLVLTTPDQVTSIGPEQVRPPAIAITAVHPMGTLRLGDDPRHAVVKSTSEHHQVRGLFVLDGSLFPTSLGAPPQISIYSFSKHLAPHVAAYLGA